MKTRIFKLTIGAMLLAIVSYGAYSFTTPKTDLTETSHKTTSETLHKTVKINGHNIFYREAGNTTKPTILLLHGYPTSSHMFRNLITDLSVRYHVIAPDYPGFGRSDQPKMKDFDYTFDNMANIVDAFLHTLNIKKYSIYLMDYGAPIGFRIASKYPERVESLIIQNGNS
jgi:pimeloyl-ACP methyl ester carboxylesterase